MLDDPSEEGFRKLGDHNQAVEPDSDSPDFSGPSSIESGLSNCFRLMADFVVDAKPMVEYLQTLDLTAEQRRLALTTLTTPEAFHRMCRMAIVSELESETGVLEEQFYGPQSEDILACVLPHLSDEDQQFWKKLHRESPDHISDFLVLMFNAFQTTLRSVAITDMTNGETIPRQVRRERIL